MTTSANERERLNLITMLPAIYQEMDEQGRSFLYEFLRVFEQVLLGNGDPGQLGLSEALDGIVDADGIRQVAGIERTFTPGPDQAESQRAPREFLVWLAGWVALSLSEEWSESEQRYFVANIAQIYRLRGTRAGLILLLKAYTRDEPRIWEFSELPHFFQVELKVVTRSPVERLKKERLARAIIDREKPAHTYYALRVIIPDLPTIQVGRISTVGVDTLLGTLVNGPGGDDA